MAWLVGCRSTFAKSSSLHATSRMRHCTQCTHCNAELCRSSRRPNVPHKLPQWCYRSIMLNFCRSFWACSATQHPFCCSPAMFERKAVDSSCATVVRTEKQTSASPKSLVTDNWPQRNEERTRFILLKPRPQAAVLIGIVSIQWNKFRKFNVTAARFSPLSSLLSRKSTTELNLPRAC